LESESAAGNDRSLSTPPRRRPHHGKQWDQTSLADRSVSIFDDKQTHTGCRTRIRRCRCENIQTDRLHCYHPWVPETITGKQSTDPLPCQTPRTCITMETGIAIFIAVMAIVVALVCVWALYTINNRPARFFPGHTHRLWYQMEAPQRGTTASRPGGQQGGQEELAV